MRRSKQNKQARQLLAKQNKKIKKELYKKRREARRAQAQLGVNTNGL